MPLQPWRWISNLISMQMTMRMSMNPVPKGLGTENQEILLRNEKLRKEAIERLGTRWVGIPQKSSGLPSSVLMNNTIIRVEELRWSLNSLAPDTLLRVRIELYEDQS